MSKTTITMAVDDLRLLIRKMVAEELKAISRKGGLKGGHRRAQLLTKRQLSSIGKMGAAARWRGTNVT